MRNLHIQVNEIPNEGKGATGSGPNQTGAARATLSPAAFKKLEQTITDKLRKDFSVLMSTGKTGIAPFQSPDSRGTRKVILPVPMDPRVMNTHVLDILAKAVEGKRIQSLPKIVCNDGATHPDLDFSSSHQLINHRDFTNEVDKQCAVFLSGHREGCLICLFLLNRFGKKFIILPHLNFTPHNRVNYFPSRNSSFCPSLLRMNQASRLELVNKITGLCAGCLRRRGANMCQTCNGKNNVSCRVSQKHPYLCACARCVTSRM